MATATRKRTKPGRAPRIESVRLWLAIDCTGCMRPLRLDAIAPEVRCRACLHRMALDAAWWAEVAKARIAEARAGTSGRTVDFGDVFTVVSRNVAAEPACPGCGVAIEAAGLAAGRAHDCACGVRLTVRAADELVRAIHPKALAVAGERAAIEPAAVEPVAFRCPRCASCLRTDGTSRAIACAACAVEVDVPEALWDALHPVPPPAPIYLLLGGGR